MALSDPMLINEVHGPNQWGFYNINAKGPAGEIRLDTKDAGLAMQAAGGKGGWWQIQYTSKTVEKNGKEYVNYYLEKIDGIAGEDVAGPTPAPAASVQPTPTSGRSPDSEMRIMRQSAVLRAVEFYAPLPKAPATEGEFPEQHYQNILVVAERFLDYFVHGPYGSEPEDADLPSYFWRGGTLDADEPLSAGRHRRRGRQRRDARDHPPTRRGDRQPQASNEGPLRDQRDVPVRARR